MVQFPFVIRQGETKGRMLFCPSFASAGVGREIRLPPLLMAVVAVARAVFLLLLLLALAHVRAAGPALHLAPESLIPGATLSQARLALGVFAGAVEALTSD